MATPKYKKYYDLLIVENQELFEEISTLFAKLEKNASLQEEFDDLRRKVIRVIAKYEDQLCSKTERTKFANFSTGLSEKFWELIRLDYPYL